MHRPPVPDHTDDIARAAIAAVASEAEIRRILADINPRIRDMNRRSAPGPPTSVMPFDEDAVIEAWRTTHGG